MKSKLFLLASAILLGPSATQASPGASRLVASDPVTKSHAVRICDDGDCWWSYRHHRGRYWDDDDRDHWRRGYRDHDEDYYGRAPRYRDDDDNNHDHERHGGDWDRDRDHRELGRGDERERSAREETRGRDKDRRSSDEQQKEMNKPGEATGSRKD